jgi:hypothetical protein
VNKPIRVVSVFCLVLFMALLVNATYLMYVRADSLSDDPRNRRIITATFSRERGAILVGKEAIARSVPSNDKYKFQRTYSEPFKYAPITGYFSWFNQTGVERSQNSVLAGDDSRLFVTRLVDLLSNTDPKGGNVQLTVDRAARTPRGTASRHCPVTPRAPSSRSSPAPDGCWRWPRPRPSTPTASPPTTSLRSATWARSSTPTSASR